MSLFFFNDTATTEIYTLSLHDALPISRGYERKARVVGPVRLLLDRRDQAIRDRDRAGNDIGIEDEPSVDRSEEHTSELQSRPHLVCRLLLEKKNSVHLRR